MRNLLLAILALSLTDLYSQNKVFSREDTLFGSNTSYRDWWDVTHYDVAFRPDYHQRSIAGDVTITYQVTKEQSSPILQIDLQEPLGIDSIFVDGSKTMHYRKEANRYMLNLLKQDKNSEHRLRVFYHGKPKVAKNPPWGGGFIWKKDSLGNPWMSVACQGDGASTWYPCKDLQADEPNQGARLSITVPDTLNAIGNGKLIGIRKEAKGFQTYTWEVKNPINTYNITPYIGKYVLIRDSVAGEKGTLHTDYWVLGYHKEKVASHLKPNVTNMLKCFEYWFGPYPFYEDSYKLVEAPFLGMEHQSNVAYGNLFMNGYLGRDLSRTGWGLKWDFIVIHESGHEWFGNSITARDVADNWIHEGFTSYSEVLYTECEFGKEAGNDYCVGVRRSIENDIPLIGKYEVRTEGSGDIYNKGSNVVHMIRQVMNNDTAFRELLRAINATFYHKTVSTQELEAFISKKSGIDFTPMFDQYLRTTRIPKLEYKLVKGKLSFRYVNCIPGFNMPVRITMLGKEKIIQPTSQWQTILVSSKLKEIKLDRNVYVDLIK